MATVQENKLFAPPSREELDIFAPPTGRYFDTPPTAEELGVFAPPTSEELGVPKYLQQEDFERIGRKYQIDPEELREISPYLQVKAAPRDFPEAVTAGAKGTIGFVGSAALLNLPQYLYKKTQKEPMRKAIDELQEIAREQATPLEAVREFIIPGVGIPRAITAGKGVIRGTARLAEAGGLGTVAGAAGAREGEETEGAKRGAVLGLGLGGAAELLGRRLSRKHKLNKLDESLYEKQTRTGELNLEQGVEDISKRTAQSEDTVRDLVFREKTALNNKEMENLIEQQLGEGALARHLDPATEEGQFIRDRVRKRAGGEVTEEAIRRQLTDDIIDARVRDFAEDITGKSPKTAEEAIESIEKLSSRQGVEAVQNRYEDFVRLKQAERYLAETGARASDQPNFFGRTLNFISDNQFVLRHIDETRGSRTEGILQDINRSFNRSTFALREFRERQGNIFREARKAGTDREIVTSTRILDALESGDVSGLSQAEQKTARSFREYFDGIRDFANRAVKLADSRIAALNIPYLKNYIPHLMRPISETVPLIERKLEQGLEELSQKFGRKIEDLSQLSRQELQLALKDSKHIQDLERTLGMFDKAGTGNAPEFSAKLKQMLYSRDGNIALETAARAALERRGQIPSYLRETNLYKLMDMYTANTLRHLYLRNGIDKLRYEAKALRKGGAEVEAQYVQNLIQDILGVRRGTAAEAFMQSKIRVNRSLDKLIDKYGKDSLRGGILVGAKAIPDMLHSMSRQIYPNVLGYWNVRAALQNLTAGITKVAPELGTSYGYGALLRGSVYTLGNLPRLVRKAREMGAVPAEFTRKGERAVAEGIRRSALYAVPAGALEGMGRAGMSLYQAAESFNRALVLGVGEVMARDLARGSNTAIGALRKFPPAIRKAVVTNRQNPERVSEIIGKYLNDTTQFNYNRASLSEFGRTLGPIFSTFSKWPTATIGDIIHEIRSKGALKASGRIFEKYFAPLLLLQTIDAAMGESTYWSEGKGLSDRQKKLFGSSGLSQTAPIGAAGAILTGEIFSPPVVDALTQGIIVPLLAGDSSGLARGGASIVQNFTPSAGLFRFITDDLVTLATGIRPEGTFLERTEEGARTIRRAVD